MSAALFVFQHQTYLKAQKNTPGTKVTDKSTQYVGQAIEWTM